MIRCCRLSGPAITPRDLMLQQQSAFASAGALSVCFSAFMQKQAGHNIPHNICFFYFKCIFCIV